MPWASMGLCGALWGSMGHYGQSMDLWGTVGLHSMDLWGAMGHRGVTVGLLWGAMGCYGVLWGTMG